MKTVNDLAMTYKGKEKVLTTFTLTHTHACAQ